MGASANQMNNGFENCIRGNFLVSSVNRMQFSMSADSSLLCLQDISCIATCHQFICWEPPDGLQFVHRLFNSDVLYCMVATEVILHVEDRIIPISCLSQ